MINTKVVLMIAVLGSPAALSAVLAPKTAIMDSNGCDHELTTGAVVSPRWIGFIPHLLQEFCRLSPEAVWFKVWLRATFGEYGNDARLAPMPLPADLGEQTRDLGVNDGGRGEDVLDVG